MNKKNQPIEFPDCWEELQPEEWEYLLYLRDLLANHKGLTLLDLKRAWTAMVMRNRGLKRRGSKTRHLLLIDQLADTLQWMWSEQVHEASDHMLLHYVDMNFDSTQNLLPCWQDLHGPASHGADLTFGEFRAATTAMMEYEHRKEDVSLLALTAILYRPAFKQNGCTFREPYQEKYLPHYMKLASEMPKPVQWGVYAWFSSFCRYLYTGVFIIDGLEISFAPLFEKSGKQETDSTASQNLGLSSILYSVAESGIFGTVNDTESTTLLRVMMKLLMDKQQADAIRQKTR